MTKTLALVTTALALALFAPAAQAARPDAPDCEAARKAVQAEIDAACPCDGPSAQGNYTHCVTKKLRELSACEAEAKGKRSCGPVPRQCAAEIRRTAAHSACGRHPEMVTCCVPKQRDCAGDPSPGDGNKEGKCSGTSIACDRITECLLPKCQLAANAERCDLIGGTVGHGRDCTTACAP
jgi:hypothetical protein